MNRTHDPKFRVLKGLFLVWAMVPFQVSSAGAPTPDPATRRVIHSGAMVGFSGPEHTGAWLGIPYAAPPVGPIRWRAPRPVESWTVTRPALSVGSACSQTQFPAPSNGVAGLVGNEDCLYLNVWTPQPDSGVSDQNPARGSRAPDLPVMVWIHGGANVLGQGGTFDGSTLASTQQVIVVTLNYRLGILGWFRYSALHEPAASAEDRSGNYGTLDIIQALRWVKANIQTFGGDPSRITIFGESSGGVNVFSLVASPLAAGLFQRAIVQSGGTSTSTAAWAENPIEAPFPGSPLSSSEILLQLIVDDGRAATREEAKQRVATMDSPGIADYLRRKTPADLSRATQHILARHNAGFLSAPQLVGDGIVLPLEGISAAFARGTFNKVPMLLGSTRDEWSIFLGAETPFGDLRGLAVEYLSKLVKVKGVDEPAANFSHRQSFPVFVYRFDWDELSPAPWLNGASLGATHGLDVPFVFGNRNLGPEFFQLSLFKPESEASYRALSRAMMSYWTQFAATGDPGAGRTGDLPQWPPWKTTGHHRYQTLLLGTSVDGVPTVAELHVTKDLLLEELLLDPRVNPLAAKCAFLAHLLVPAESVGQLSESDYTRFDGGSCPSRSNRN